jgi:hypothetical protein
MTKSKRRSIDRSLDLESGPACENAAVAHCCDAWKYVYQASTREEDGDTARQVADEAYRIAMPPLSGYQNICDFLACAAHGILIGAIEEKSGTKLLYAAQIALSTIRQQPKAAEPAAA